MGLPPRFISVSLTQCLRSNDRKGEFIPNISVLLMRQFDEAPELEGSALVKQHLKIDPRVGLGEFPKWGAFRSVM